jgi:hypothetical protein
MNTNDQSIFWESVPTSLRNAIEHAVPASILQDRLSLSTQPDTLASKYTLLESLLKDIIKQEYQTTHLSNNQFNHHQSKTLHISALFPLAMLQTESHHYTAAESTWRTLLSTTLPSQPDLAAMSNLIDVLNLQHRYSEADTLAVELLPVIQNKLGENSPQSLGCMRKLMLSLVEQGKGVEAREVLQKGVELVGTISDEDVNKEEQDAMREMAGRIDSLA